MIRPEEPFLHRAGKRWMPSEMIVAPLLDSNDISGPSEPYYALLINPFYPKDPNASFYNELPPGTGDVSGFSVLQFRGTVNFTDARNEPNVPQDFSVTLTDASGNSAIAVVSASSAALYFPPGRLTPLSWAIPKLIHNGVRIPLVQFKGIDLTNLQSLQFNFDQQPQGALLISDILFAD